MRRGNIPNGRPLDEKRRSLLQQWIFEDGLSKTSADLRKNRTSVALAGCGAGLRDEQLADFESAIDALSLVKAMIDEGDRS